MGLGRGIHNVRTVIYTNDEQFAELQSDWNSLLEKSYATTLFSTWDWLYTWWSVYRPGELFVVGVYRDDKLIGIAPWYVDSRLTVRGIGCVEVTDYYDLIIDRNHIPEVMQCFCDVLVQNDELVGLNLCNIPANSPTLQHLTDRLHNSEFLIQCEQLEVCPVIDLPDTWSEYLQQLDKKQRHEIRRKLRRASGAMEISHYTVDGRHHRDLNAELEQFFSLMEASDPQKSVFLDDPENVAFFKAIAKIAYEKNWLQLDFLKFNDEYVSAYFNFSYRKRLYIYNSGLAYEPYGHLSPGIVLLARVIENAIKDDIEVVDFLRGDETYKYRMGGKDTAVFSLTAALPSKQGV